MQVSSETVLPAPIAFENLSPATRALPGLIAVDTAQGHRDRSWPAAAEEVQRRLLWRPDHERPLLTAGRQHERRRRRRSAEGLTRINSVNESTSQRDDCR